MKEIIQSLSMVQKRAIVLCLDALIVVSAALLAFVVIGPAVEAFDSLLNYATVLPYIMLLVAVFSYAVGLYEMPLRTTEANASGPTAFVAAGVVLASVLLCAVFGQSYPLGFHAVFAMSFFLLSLIGRLVVVQVVTQIYRRSEDRCRVLIYGAGTTGTQLALALRRHKSIEPVAFIDDNVTLQGLRIMRLPVLSPLKIEEIVQTKQVRRVLLAAASLSQPKKAQLTKRLEAMGLEVQVLPSFAQLIGEAPLVDKLKPVSAQDFLGRDEVASNWQTTENFYNDRVVLVTGAGGSIGAELCRQVLEFRPAKLVLFELSELALYTIKHEMEMLSANTSIQIVGVLGSVTETRQVRKVMQDHGIQVVLHAAAYKHVPIVEENPLSGLVNNVLGTQTLVQQAIKAGVERFILISSDKAVRPTNVMGASKRLAECVLQSAGMSAATDDLPIFSTVRFGNVLGSSGSVVPRFQEQLNRGGPLTVTDPQVMRYFMTVQEAVRLVLKSGSMARGNEVFVLDMGEPISILKLARQVIENAGYTVKDEATPQGDIEIEITGLRPGEKMVEELTLSNVLDPTEHAKIFAAREVPPTPAEIAAVLRDLREAFVGSDEELARTVAMQFVEPPQADRAAQSSTPKLA